MEPVKGRLFLTQISFWCFKGFEGRAFPFENDMKLLPSYNSNFFCLGNIVGKYFNNGSIQEEDRHLVNRYLHSGETKKNNDHLLLQCKRIENYGPSCLLFLESIGLLTTSIRET